MDVVAAGLQALRRAGIEAVRRYHRLTITTHEPMPDEPCLIVANHGFGGVVDLNVWASLAAIEQCTDRPVTSLMHQIAWTVGAGRIAEKAGAVPAGYGAARAAFERGDHVLVFPGGDREAAKPWSRRNQVEFHARSGFAQLAIEADVPIVPIVTAGAGESLLVLSEGSGIPGRLGLKEVFHSDVLPTTISVPWGLNVGIVGLVPYLPLPTKLDTVVLTAIRPREGQGREALAGQVHDLMQQTLTELTADRVPLLGRRQG